MAPLPVWQTAIAAPPAGVARPSPKACHVSTAALWAAAWRGGGETHPLVAQLRWRRWRWR